jgi:serine/threonine-protein kinase PpkA
MNHRMPRRAMLAAGVALPFLSRAAFAQEREALAIPGKRSLYQRVLTRPAAAPRPTPGGAAGTALPPLTPLYVYERANGPDGAPWVQLGRAARGAPLGWVAEREVIEWRHTLTARFRNPAGRPRTVIMHRQIDLQRLLGDGNPAQAATALIAQAARPPVPADFPVLALEPAAPPDPERNFYLLPILQAEPFVSQDGREYQMVELASVPVEQPPPPQDQPFALDIAFVLDTTLSMDPYIERVRNALTELARGLAAQRDSRVRFALVGYQNSREVQPRLDYLTRIFARFADSADPAGFAQKLAAIRATQVDSLSFNEDSFAGLHVALQDLDWGGPERRRVIVLVTDAGARNDQHAAPPRLAPADLGRLARERRTNIVAMHLRTPQGRQNHDQAEAQYTELTTAAHPLDEPAYIAVPGGEQEAMNRATRRLLDTLVRAVRGQPPEAAPAAPGPEADAAAIAERLGAALRLDWVGRRDNARAPDVLRGWAPDGYRGTEPPENFEIRLLLTRNQLNSLAQSLRVVVREGRAGMLSGDGVYDALRRLAAENHRGAQLPQRGAERLDDLVAEFLDGLPYRSRLAGMTRARWRQMSAVQQDLLLTDLERRVEFYREINETPGLWWPREARDDRERGEQMYPVPLDRLP